MKRNIKLPSGWMGSVCLWIIRVCRYIRNWMRVQKNGIQKVMIALVVGVIVVFFLPVIILLSGLLLAVFLMLGICVYINEG